MQQQQNGQQQSQKQVADLRREKGQQQQQQQRRQKVGKQAAVSVLSSVALGGVRKNKVGSRKRGSLVVVPAAHGRDAQGPDALEALRKRVALLSGKQQGGEGAAKTSGKSKGSKKKR